MSGFAVRKSDQWTTEAVNKHDTLCNYTVTNNDRLHVPLYFSTLKEG
jgi:hypothetical protein